mmetsp:Transcript_15787/g.40120  ORF Transcript_15787/g.40120 Transcript_15787/m.40120 type:complete len:271 (+) Transcript_15787:192-1004(+)
MALKARGGKSRKTRPCGSWSGRGPSHSVENKLHNRLPSGANMSVSLATLINSPPTFSIKISLEEFTDCDGEREGCCCTLEATAIIACVAACAAKVAASVTSCNCLLRVLFPVIVATSSERTLMTWSTGIFLYSYFQKVGPNADMSKMCMCKELTELCPNTWKNKPTLSLQPPTLAVYRRAAAFISSSSAKAAEMSRPPSLGGTRPKDKALNHCQWRSLVVRKRCLHDIEALPTHSTSSESQCASFSGLLQQIMNLSLNSPRCCCSSSMPG